MTTKCGIRGIKNIEKDQNVEGKVYCFKDSDKTVANNGKKKGENGR